jgi:hypothetical protein
MFDNILIFLVGVLVGLVIMFLNDGGHKRLGNKGTRNEAGFCGYCGGDHDEEECGNYR